MPRNHPTSSQEPLRNSRVAAVQAQIDDTVGIMRENITRAAERQERLDHLEARAGSCVKLMSCSRLTEHLKRVLLQHLKHFAEMQIESARYASLQLIPDGCSHLP
jgi:hypothetical protein